MSSPSTSAVRTSIACDASPPTAHVVQFYETDAFLADTVAWFLASGFAASGAGGGESAVVVSTRAHRSAIERRLRARGVDLSRACRERRYLAFDAAELLGRFMIDGSPDPTRFDDVIGTTIARAVAAAPGRRVRAFGEMVALLWAEGRSDAALRLEELWNGLARRAPLSLLCAYPIKGVGCDVAGGRFDAVCDAHGGVRPAESYPVLDGEPACLRAIVDLQQKAGALATETAYRQRAEAALRERDDRLRALVEAAPVPIVVIDRDTTVRLWNPAAERVFGWRADEVLGAPLPIVPPEERPGCQCVRDAVARGETFTSVETTRLRRDGSRVDVLVSAAPLELDPQAAPQMVLTFEDVTVRKRAEAAHRQSRDVVETVHLVGQAVAAELDLERVVQLVVDAATRLTGAASGAFFYGGTEDGGGYTRYAVAGATRAVPDALPLVPPTFAGDAVVRCADVRADPRFGTTSPFAGTPLEPVAVTSYVAVPVVSRSRAVQGAIFLAHPDASHFDDQDERIVVGLATQAAIAMDNARSYERERTARAEAERARAIAEAASRAKDEFLSVVSHELRTPLAAMLGWVKVLDAGGASGPRAARAIETIERNGRLQAKLIDDLLDVSRVVTGRMRLEMRTVDLPAVMQAALDTMRPAADAKGVRLVARLDPDAGPVSGDPDRLQQTAWNLLSNAVKFTPAGGLVEMTLDRHEADVRLVVRDTGRGIAADFLPSAFERFRQADSAASRRAGGLGLGLAIVRHLVELHGGSVAVESEGEGHGATFTILLPLAPSEPAQAKGR